MECCIYSHKNSVRGCFKRCALLSILPTANFAHFGILQLCGFCQHPELLAYFIFKTTKTHQIAPHAVSAGCKEGPMATTIPAGDDPGDANANGTSQYVQLLNFMICTNHVSHILLTNRQFGRLDRQRCGEGLSLKHD